MKTRALKNLVPSALFLAIGLVLPFFTGQIPTIGKMLLPMHIPVLLCGLICGWQWGLGVGFVLPLLRSLLFGMPVMYPMAVSMAFEMAAYGALCGWLYRRLPRRKSSLYLALIGAMIGGRLVWGAARFLCAGLQPSAFGFTAFWAGAVTSAVPGIILQLVLVPILVMALEKAHLSARE